MIWITVAVFLMIFSANDIVQGQNCQAECQMNCGTDGMTRDGSEGRIVNVAYGKPATVSSVITEGQGTSGPGCMLVNGRTSTAYRTPGEGNANCVHTDLDDFAASWFVDLGRQYTIDNITIFRRGEAPRRMAGLSVLVENETTNQTCYSFPNSSDIPALDALPEQIDITCDPPLTGHKVWLQKHGQDTNGDYYFITVCEVQVWVCREGYTGVDCRCRHCKDNAKCDDEIKTCPDGCDRGWRDLTYCDQPCSNKTYGVDCGSQCGLCKNESEACDTVTGHCSACQSSLQAPLCQVCLGNKHGSSCDKQCSALCGGDGSCNRISSTCLQGCVTGYVLNRSRLCEIEDTGLDIAVVAGAAGAGIVVLLVIVVVLCVVIRRKRLSQKKEQAARYQSPETILHSPGSAEHPYDISGTTPCNPSTSGPRPISTDTDGKRQSQKPMVAVKPTVQPNSNVNTNDDSSNVYYTIDHSIDPSVLGGNQASNQPSNHPNHPSSSPPETSPRQVSAASYLGPEEYDDESPLAEGGHANANEDADVYASFKASEPRLDNVQKYLVDRLATGSLVAEFSDIKKVADGVVQHAGALPKNSKKNRFKKILPYDRNRIFLQDRYTEDLATDYINASYITGYYSSKQFIAAQGPKPNTMGDFWRMVWEEKTGHVVMLTNILENGKTKCEQYWPEEEGATQTYGPVTVTTTDIQCRDDFFVRTFRIKRDGSNESREVTQYHFTAWPDHGVPTTTSLVTFYRYVSGRTASSGERAAAPPIVVHCSAGVGRTGTYIGLDIGINRAVKDGSVDTLDLVTSLREERCLMVQAVDQYTFLHKALLEAYSAHGTNVSVDTFEGVFPQQIASGSRHPRLDKEFLTLQQMLTLQPEQRLNVASLEENIAKNRDRTVLPSDSHLVYLDDYVAGRNQYINAVFMPTFRDSRGCVVTQLPLPDTLVDFWRLVYGSDITTVVSLSAPNEEKEVKPYCQYWPTKNGGHVKSGPYDVTLMSRTQLPGSDVTTYSLKLAKKDVASAKSLQLLHYKGWTGEVGGSSSDILHLIDTLVTSHLHTNRLVVQCSDGVKKSGLFCTLLDVINRMTYDREVDVYMTIRHVQSVTPKAITSAVQYRYCYEVVQSRVREMVSIYGNAPAR